MRNRFEERGPEFVRVRACPGTVGAKGKTVPRWLDAIVTAAVGLVLFATCLTAAGVMGRLLWAVLGFGWHAWDGLMK